MSYASEIKIAMEVALLVARSDFATCSRASLLEVGREALARAVLATADPELRALAEDLGATLERLDASLSQKAGI